MPEPDPTESLLQYVRSGNRVCPRPDRWDELYRVLVRAGRACGAPPPPPPLILAAWSEAPALGKIIRLRHQVEYAVEVGAFAEVDRFLRSLSETDWAHVPL